MNPWDSYYCVERGHAPREFLTGFIADNCVWSRDRTVAMCWQASGDAEAFLARYKGKPGFLTALIATVSPWFAKNLQPPAASPPPEPTPTEVKAKKPVNGAKPKAKKSARNTG